MTLILGIDPSTRMSAYCIMGLDKKVYDYGKLVMNNLNVWAEKIKQVEVVAIESQYIKHPSKDKDVVVIEGSHTQYISHESKNRVKGSSILKIAEAAGMLKGLAIYLGKEVYSVNPKAWQAKLLKANIRSRKEVLKRLSKEYASAIVGKRINDSDISDSVMLAEYERERLANQKMQKKAK